jgi:hypothetical protein
VKKENKYFDRGLEAEKLYRKDITEVMDQYGWKFEPRDGFGNKYYTSDCAEATTGCAGPKVEDWITRYLKNFVKAKGASNQTPYDHQHKRKPIFVNLKAQLKNGPPSGIAAGTKVEAFYRDHKEEAIFLIATLYYVVNDERMQMVFDKEIEIIRMDSLINAQIKERGYVASDRRNWGETFKALSGRLQRPAKIDYTLKKYCPKTYDAARKMMMRLGEYIGKKK